MKRADSETFSIGLDTRARLQRHADATGMKKSEIVRQGINLALLGAEAGISPELYRRAVALLLEVQPLLAGFIKEVGGVCDHAAGFCICGERAAVDGIAEFLTTAGVEVKDEA